MKNIFIVPIEPIDTRYTKQWYNFIPRAIDHAAKVNLTEVNVINVEGEQVPPVPTPGAFLDFGATNIFKSSQLSTIAEQFQLGNVKPGDKFLFTDAWNPTAISVKYMSELLNIPVELHGMWHAGSYDPQDFLGRLIGDKPWVRHSEKAMFHCYDTNWFATDFHIDLFVNELFGPFNNKDVQKRSFDETKSYFLNNNKICQTGWPMSYLYDVLEPYIYLQKNLQVVFPHRIAPEKQLDIFKDLEKSMPYYTWVVCQEKSLTKEEYHQILGESSIVFSANLQETYGISCIEGLICNAAPLVPDRLSYSEMYTDHFKYPSKWTEDFNSYLKHKDELMKLIRRTINHVGSRSMTDLILNQKASLKKYVYADNLISALVK